MLDLEIPTQWSPETNIERNRLRLSLHLNIAACCLRTRDYVGAIFHATRALRTQPKNVKALFRRGSAHLALFRERATALDAALADLEMARQLEPENREVANKLLEARAKQKQVSQRIHGSAGETKVDRLKLGAALADLEMARQLDEG
jgi:tetratricopeptide (TPR) repeat protein